MRHTKAQEMPYAAIIKALIVLVAGLAIFLVVSSGFLQKAIKEWFGQTDVILGDEQSGDYILRAGPEELTGTSATLHITPNPLRCAEIDDSNSFVIYQASSASPDIPDEAFKDNEVERISRHENCDRDQTVNFTLMEVDKPLNTHIIRLEVWGENPREVLETIDLEVNMWSVFLSGLMGVSVARLESSGLSEPHRSPIGWSLNMHTDPGLISAGKWPNDQSRQYDAEYRIRDVREFLGIGTNPYYSIPDLPSFAGKTFKDAVVDIYCTYPDINVAAWNSRGASASSGQLPQMKADTFQVIVTAAFGDLQDFGEESGRPDTPGQPFPMIRPGMGPRGWTNSGDTDQLLPMKIRVNYPETDDSEAWYLDAMIRARRNSDWTHDDVFGGSADGSVTFDAPEGSCLAGKQLIAEMWVCPEEECQLGG